MQTRSAAAGQNRASASGSSDTIVVIGVPVRMLSPAPNRGALQGLNRVSGDVRETLASARVVNVERQSPANYLTDWPLRGGSHVAGPRCRREFMSRRTSP